MITETSRNWLIRGLTLGTAVAIAALLIVDAQRVANPAAHTSRQAWPGDDGEADNAKSDAPGSGLSDAPFFGPSTKSTIGIGNGGRRTFQSREEDRDDRESAGK